MPKTMAIFTAIYQRRVVYRKLLCVIPIRNKAKFPQARAKVRPIWGWT